MLSSQVVHLELGKVLGAALQVDYPSSIWDVTTDQTLLTSSDTMVDHVFTSTPSSPVDQTPTARDTAHPAATFSTPDDKAVPSQDHDEQGAQTFQVNDEPPPCRIMKLPSELRLRIYKCLYESVFQDVFDQVSVDLRDSRHDQAAYKAALDQNRKTSLTLLHTSGSFRVESAEDGAKLVRALEDDLVVQFREGGNASSDMADRPKVEVIMELELRLSRVRRVSALLWRVRKNVREAERKKAIKLRMSSG